jgi:hypothetical protein
VAPSLASPSWLTRASLRSDRHSELITDRSVILDGSHARIAESECEINGIRLVRMRAHCHVRRAGNLAGGSGQVRIGPDRCSHAAPEPGGPGRAYGRDQVHREGRVQLDRPIAVPVSIRRHFSGRDEIALQAGPAWS